MKLLKTLLLIVLIFLVVKVLLSLVLGVFFSLLAIAVPIICFIVIWKLFIK